MRKIGRCVYPTSLTRSCGHVNIYLDVYTEMSVAKNYITLTVNGEEGGGRKTVLSIGSFIQPMQVTNRYTVQLSQFDRKAYMATSTNPQVQVQVLRSQVQSTSILKLYWSTTRMQVQVTSTTPLSSTGATVE